MKFPLKNCRWFTVHVDCHLSASFPILVNLDKLITDILYALHICVYV